MVLIATRIKINDKTSTLPSATPFLCSSLCASVYLDILILREYVTFTKLTQFHSFQYEKLD